MPRIVKKTRQIVDLIQDFLDYCSYKNLSIKTIKSYNQTLILFIRYLEEEKGITLIVGLILKMDKYTKLI